MTEANSINAATTGIVGNTGTSFTGTAVTQYNVLVGGSTSSTLSNVAPSSTSGVPLISEGSSSNPAFGTAVVAGGGTGATSFNTTGVVISGATSTTALSSVTLTDGQLAIGSSAGNPAAATLTAGTGISITNGHNSISIAATGGGLTFAGDSGTATPSGGTITFNANTNCGSSVVFSGASATVSLKVTDSNNNTIIGSSAGNGSITGTENTMMGHLAGNALSSGLANVGIGYQALGNISSGQNNVAIGLGAGVNYASSESSNIVIGPGVGGTLGESNVIRIGAQGSSTAQQNKCFIAGISGVTVSNTNLVTINTSTTQLGSMTYATGTWTPGIAFGGSSTGITYSAQNGQYTQIGNMIIAGFVINLSSKGSATGNATITGLPVSMGSNANSFTCVLAGGGITLSTNYTVLLARGTTSATTLDMTQFGSGQTYITATNTNFSNSSGLSGTIIYTTA